MWTGLFHFCVTGEYNNPIVTQQELLRYHGNAIGRIGHATKETQHVTIHLACCCYLQITVTLTACCYCPASIYIYVTYITSMTLSYFLFSLLYLHLTIFYFIFCFVTSHPLSSPSLPFFTALSHFSLYLISYWTILGQISVILLEATLYIPIS
jgi:hypothetical protein